MTPPKLNKDTLGLKTLRDILIEATKDKKFVRIDNSEISLQFLPERIMEFSTPTKSNGNIMYDIKFGSYDSRKTKIEFYRLEFVRILDSLKEWEEGIEKIKWDDYLGNKEEKNE